MIKNRPLLAALALCSFHLARADSAAPSAADDLAEAQHIANVFHATGYPDSKLNDFVKAIRPLEPALTDEVAALIPSMVKFAEAWSGQPAAETQITIGGKKQDAEQGMKIPAVTGTTDQNPSQPLKALILSWTPPSGVKYTSAPLVVGPNLQAAQFNNLSFGNPLPDPPPTGTVVFTAFKSDSPTKGVLIATLDLKKKSVEFAHNPLEPGSYSIVASYSGNYPAATVNSVMVVVDGSDEAIEHAAQTELDGYPVARKIYYAHMYGVKFSEGEKPDHSDQEKWSDFASPSSPYQEEYKRFLKKFGSYKPKSPPQSQVPANTSAEKPSTTSLSDNAQQSPTDASPKPSAAAKQSLGAQGAEKQGGTGKATTITEQLRDYGISFAEGLGYVGNTHGGSGTSALIVRWNWLQERSTIRWNDWVRESAGTYPKIPYFGRQGWDLVEDRIPNPYDDNPKKIQDILTYRWSVANPVRTIFSPNTFGPFFGGGVIGNKVAFGHDDKGAVISQRPYLVGLSFGWGRYEGGASTVYVDVGASISPTTGFAYSKPYIGFSLDASLFGDVFDYIRNSKPVPSDQPATDK